MYFFELGVFLVDLEKILTIPGFIVTVDIALVLDVDLLRILCKILLAYFSDEGTFWICLVRASATVCDFFLLIFFQRRN